MPPMVSEYRNGTPKATAIQGAVTGVNQATNKMALTMATPIVDVSWLRIKCGSGYGTNIDTAFKANTAIKKGDALQPRVSVAMSTRTMCRISSLVGEPPLRFGPGTTREVIRSNIAAMATMQRAVQATSYLVPTTMTKIT